MPNGVQQLDPIAIAQEFALAQELLGESPNEPVRRLLEYQAYVQLVGLLSAQDALPEEYGVGSLDLAMVRDWIRGMRSMPFTFADRMKKLVLQLKTSGSSASDNICKFYCAHKNSVEASFSLVSVGLGASQAAAFIKGYGLDVLLFHGVPVTTFAAVAIKFGLLDDICDCKR